MWVLVDTSVGVVGEPVEQCGHWGYVFGTMWMLWVNQQNAVSVVGNSVLC